MLFLLNDRIPDSKKQPVLEALLQELKPIDIAVRVANALAESSTGTIQQLQRNVDLRKVRLLVISRFRKEYAEAKVDIFETDRRPTYVLYQLGTYDTDASRMVNEYTLSICSKTPSHIGELLLSFVLQFPSEEPTLQFDQLKTVFDVEALAKLARSVRNQAWSNEKEKGALEMFLDAAGPPSAPAPQLHNAVWQFLDRFCRRGCPLFRGCFLKGWAILAWSSPFFAPVKIPYFLPRHRPLSRSAPLRALPLSFLSLTPKVFESTCLFFKY
jgi:hypothetical protein